MADIMDARVSLVIGKKSQRHIEMEMYYERAELGIKEGADDKGTWIDLEPFEARVLFSFLRDKWIPNPL